MSQQLPVGVLRMTAHLFVYDVSSAGKRCSMNQLEEGHHLNLEFGKIQSAAASEQPHVPVVLQSVHSKEVLFVGHANPEALAETLETGRAVLWSTSRNELWRKGATSADWLDVDRRGAREL